MYKIAVIPGDGIGKEVMEAALNVLDSLDINFNYTNANAGNECFEKTGTTIPDKTIKTDTRNSKGRSFTLICPLFFCGRIIN